MNQTLSENRATALKKPFDWKNGIKADRLNSTGLVKLNQLILTKTAGKHTTEELKFP
jgi:hypothetical protein